MADDILRVIEEEMKSSPTSEELKIILAGKGFSEQDIDKALQKYSDKLPQDKSKDTRKNVQLFSTKEVFDRVGYGFATHQFINILFYQAAILGGVGHIALFLVAVFNGIKGLLSSSISSFLQEYRKVHHISKNTISRSGIIFGFSFFVMAIGYQLKLWWLFGIALLVGSIGVVSYGDLYNHLLRENLKKERMGSFLAHAGQYGVLITAVSLLASGWLLENFPVPGEQVVIFGQPITIVGFILSFMITAIAFILSGYIVSFIKEKQTGFTYALGTFIKEYRQKIKQQRKLLIKNRIIVLLLITSVLLGVVQALGNSFYGIYIFNEFRNVLFGGFLNVAVIYTVAVLVSVLGPWVTTRVNRSIGYAPMLVFGTMLIAIMPAVAAWNPSFYALGVANAVSILGAAIVGAAQGLLARKLLREEERNLYFANLSTMILVPFILLLPLGAWIGNMLGLVFLFKILVFTLVCAVVPLYIILVGFANKRRL